MSKFLVTGGCGFIGSHLCKYLIDQGHQVVVLDNLDSGKRENLPEGAELVVDSVTNQDCVEKLFQDIDGCFHLAAIASVVRCQQEWVQSHKVNTLGFVHLLSAAKVKKIPVVFASSAAVYGNSKQLPLHEEESVTQISFYAVDKFNCERQAKVAYEQFGIPCIGLRFFNVYGPGQDPRSSYSGVISIFADKIKNRETLQLFGDGEQTRDFIYVADVVQYLYLSMFGIKDIGYDIFNVCSGEAHSLKQLITILGDIVGFDAAISYLPAREGDIKFSQGSAKKVIDKLGYKPQYSLEAGLRLFLQEK